MEFSYYNPTRLIFGDGTFARLGKVTAPWGRHAMLVTGRSAMEKAGHLQKAQELLEAAGLEVTVFNKIPPNPQLDVISEGGQIAREAGCDVLVGLGGGSAMDSAKNIAVAATHDSLTEFLLPNEAGKKKPPTEATLPIIAVTSTAGTSSELTPFAVVTVPDSREKTSVTGDTLYARVAIDDPELTYSMPPEVTAGTGVDVIGHAAEGYISTVANPITDLWAVRAIELVAAHLPAAVADGEDPGARRGMMLANVFAGYVLSQNGTNMMHGVGHPISGRYPEIPHGAALATVLVTWAAMSWQRAPEKFARIARIFGVDDPDDQEAACRTGAALRAFLGSVNMDVRLRDLGVEEEMLEVIVDDAQRYMHHASAKTPGEVTRKDLMHLVQASY